MKNSWIRISALAKLGFSATFLLAPASGAIPLPNCALPDGLHEEIAQKYPGARLVELSDLVDQHYKDVFQKEHGDQCPGLVRVDFYGDGKPTLAFVLITTDRGKARVKFLVARKLEEGWKLRELGSTDDKPVTRSEPPGKYESVYKTKTIRAKWPVVIVCGYGSWAVAYAWMGDRVEKVWLSD